MSPTRTGQSIAANDSCRVLAARNNRENPAFRGAVLFRYLWRNALNIPGAPWSHPFSAASPRTTPTG